MYENYSKIRDSRGLNDYRVAKLANINRSMLSDWKSGRSQPKLKNLQKIADALEVPVDAITGTETPENGISAFERRMLAYWEKLNTTGQYEALKRMEELTQLKQYTGGDR